MKNSSIISFSVICFLMLTGCVSNDMTLYFVSQKEHPDAVKKIGCDEYLVPIKENAFGTVTAPKALKALFAADPKQYSEDLITASAITDGFLELEFVEERSGDAQNTFIISLRKNPKVGLTGVCDVPRFKEQLTETVRAAVSPNAFVIRLDGSPRAWECLGNESNFCNSEDPGVTVDIQ